MRIQSQITKCIIYPTHFLLSSDFVYWLFPPFPYLTSPKFLSSPSNVSSVHVWTNRLGERGRSSNHNSRLSGWIQGHTISSCEHFTSWINSIYWWLIKRLAPTGSACYIYTTRKRFLYSYIHRIKSELTLGTLRAVWQSQHPYGCPPATQPWFYEQPTGSKYITTYVLSLFFMCTWISKDAQQLCPM